MNAETRAKKLTELHGELLATYTLVVGILARLPIPMLLIERQADAPEAAIHAMSRAWELADLEPLSKLAVGRLRAMISEWLTAYEIAAVCAGPAGPAAWRLVIMETSLARARVAARYLERHLAWLAEGK